MTSAAPAAVPAGRVLHSATPPLQAVLNANGSVRHWRHGALALNLLPATDTEAGPANLVLRLWPGDQVQPRCLPLLGPAGLLRPAAAGPGADAAPGRQLWLGQVDGLQLCLSLQLAASTAAWFWHLQLRHQGDAPLTLDWLMLQDLALAPWSAVRLNEAYVSQYIDHQPLAHAGHGWLLASRQNQPVDGRAPWLLCGSLGRAVAYATDGLQTAGHALRAGQRDGLLHQALPSQRLQHEHSLVALQDQPLTLSPGQSATRGFFAWFEPDHPAASSPADLALLPQVLALPEAQPPAWPAAAPSAPGLAWQPGQAPAADHPQAARPLGSLLASAPLFAARQPGTAQLQAWLGDGWRQVETDAQGQVLSLFAGPPEAPLHAVTRAKELAVLRPHGHLLRSGRALVPDETLVASTVWMAGVFHSSLTQGHASANRLLSTTRGHLGWQRGFGLRLFIDRGTGWQLLDLPSAWACTPHSARWLYDDAKLSLEVTADVHADAPQVGLRLRLLRGAPLAVLVALHTALQGDDGLVAQDAPAAERRLHCTPLPQGLRLQAPPGSAVAQRFGDGGLQLHWAGDVAGLRWDDDRALMADGRSQGQPWLCLHLPAVRQLALDLRCTLIPGAPATAGTRPDAGPPGVDPDADAPDLPPLRWQLPPGAPADAGALADWLPWLAHNALVHYLTPRGLEQFCGGGWGTRDVCQGPVELLQAQGRHDMLRVLLCQVFAAQNADGDWPQWFMFHARDAAVRAGDSHGDIVFWPVLALADYLAATGDAGLLDEPLPFHTATGAAPERAPMAEHLARALAVIRRRTVPGTALAAYGHGDWNDALQPADPALREHLCSAWTVTLHHRTLCSLQAAWLRLGQPARAAELADWDRAVVADFQRLLIADGVLAGFARFDQGPQPALLLHPQDRHTGIRHSALAMVHAIVDELFTPEQAAEHAALIEASLCGPDGLRLFDRPLAYRGGPMTLFQRGESAAYFGREIGLMYTHAHLRWAEALHRLGRGQALWAALQQVNPIGLAARVPQAARRQANCYYSSSDAAFADRAQAWLHYERVAQGGVAFEGGWRIYSSGAGIAWRLVWQALLGLVQQPDRLGLDPVLPPAMDGLVLHTRLWERPLSLHYHVGPQGHGPQRVLLDGQPLALQPGHNRYRAPGVWLDGAVLRAALDAGAQRLELWLG